MPEDLRVGLVDFPRARWADPDVAEMARFWLGVHEGFRRHHAHLGALIVPWREGRADLRTLHGRLIPAVQQFLQHLDMHHRIESHQYFPAFRDLDPRIAHGIDLLDRDHDVVHADLERLFGAASDFHRSVTGNGPDAADQAARLSDAIDAMGPRVLRHLDDEEEIVIPLVQLRGQGLS